jgi:hypothetical protein
VCGTSASLPVDYVSYARYHGAGLPDADNDFSTITYLRKNGGWV